MYIFGSHITYQLISHFIIIYSCTFCHFFITLKTKLCEENVLICTLSNSYTIHKVHVHFISGCYMYHVKGWTVHVQDNKYSPCT